MSNRFIRLRPAGERPDRESCDACIFIAWMQPASKSWADVMPTTLDAAAREPWLALSKRLESKFEAGQILSFDHKPLQRWVLATSHAAHQTFELLGLARQILRPLADLQCRQIQVELGALPPNEALRLIDALVAAQVVTQFKAPRYSEKKAGKEASPATLELLLPAGLDLSLAKKQVAEASASAEANNRVRYLVMQAGSDLTPKRYVQTLKKLAQDEGLGFEFLSQKKLHELGAGAFLAVAQGSAHEDAGIVKLSYEPAKKKGLKRLALVGKGITFDTGGTNLKSAPHMWGMHRDMAGSAVAYALIQLAAREKWPLRVSAYLAIADNATGPRAYRQNDVVTALNGKTIEIVHTDAEGRMVLADTLHLATADSPDLVLDFATLTGACVGAISTLYSGAFTNRADWHARLIAAGQSSGERIWPFPLDADFAVCLKSDIADIKQCRLTGGVDHIEAAMFLKEFLQKDAPWVHIDLAAAENSGGLAHVDTEVTGFGVRVGAALVRDILLGETSHQRGL